MKKAFLMMTVLLLAAVFLGGCMGFGSVPLPSGQTPTPAPTVGPTVEPQVLISKADAEAIVGNALKDDDSGKLNSLPSSGMKYVNYESAASGGHFLQISIYETAFYGANVQLINPVDIFNSMKTTTPSPLPRQRLPQPRPPGHRPRPRLRPLPRPPPP